MIRNDALPSKLTLYLRRFTTTLKMKDLAKNSIMIGIKHKHDLI